MMIIVIIITTIVVVVINIKMYKQTRSWLTRFLPPWPIIWRCTEGKHASGEQAQRHIVHPK